MSQPPPIATEAVLVPGDEIPETPIVRGYDFNKGVDYSKLMESLTLTGFQATNVGVAIDTIKEMLKWRLSDEPVREGEDPDFLDPEVRKNTRCKIFLGYTSNLISSGCRESLRFLAQHKLVDVIVSSAGGIEEDFIKCMANTYLGDFALKGEDLRKRGLNRIGNLLVPNRNYCMFEDWIMPILDAMRKEQEEDGINWTPSKMIRRLGKEINHPESVYYWAYRNDIPVYCPSLTDGSIGDMLFFHSYKNPGLRLDLVEDIRSMNNESCRVTPPRKTGIIILGGGLVKHHICNANLMRNGADYAVFINTGQEFDGSDSGARPDEAISWGKIRVTAKPVKVYCDATIVLPLIVAETFAKEPSRAIKSKNDTENVTD